MKVRELIALLQRSDPEATVIRTCFCGGTLEPSVVLRDRRGGVGPRLSFDEIDVVEVLWGDLHHMRAQGMDVLGPEDLK